MLFLFLIAFAQKNRDYTHVIANKKTTYACDYATQTQDKPTHALMSTTRTTKPHLHSYQSHTKQKPHLRTMPPTHHTSPISPPTIALKPYKTKLFYGKISRFYTVFTVIQQPYKHQTTAMYRQKTTQKVRIKSIFKHNNHIEKHTIIVRHAQNHRKTVKHSKFFYKN